MSYGNNHLQDYRINPEQQLFKFKYGNGNSSTASECRSYATEHMHRPNFRRHRVSRGIRGYLCMEPSDRLKFFNGIEPDIKYYGNHYLYAYRNELQ